MNNNSEETLRRIEQNDDQFRYLRIGYSNFDSRFASSAASDYARLGAAIGNNIHLTKLLVYLGANQTLDISNEEFFDGLKRNSSVSDLALVCNGLILIGGVGHELLKSYQKNNNYLTSLYIRNAVLDNWGGNAITETLRWCRHLKTINFGSNSITDEQLLPMIEAIKGGCDTSLEHLVLEGNRIGNAGCEALATLLEDPHCSLQFVSLCSNRIGNEGATAIADSLANNTKLKKLYLRGNHFEQSVVGIFCTVLCNTSGVNDTHRSNHTLEELMIEQQGQHADHLSAIMIRNWGENKSHVAIKKILKYHPNIDMEPLFEWGVEEDGEQTLKALPYMIAWFRRAEEAVSGDDGGDYNIEERKLSAIFLFAKAMPLFFVPACQIKVNDNKRKRDDT